MKHKLIMENWRRFLAESHSEEQEQDLKDISGELKKAVKMHQSQADRIDNIVNATPDDELDEAKNKDGKEQGADGKACWDGYRYEGTEDGKDKCVKIEEDQDDDQLDEKKKKACKPTKGKASAKRVDGKCVSYGQKGKAKGGGDRVQPGTSKGDAYCARSYGDMKSHGKDCSGKDRGTPLCLSRQKWDCSGKYSRK